MLKSMHCVVYHCLILTPPDNQVQPEALALPAQGPRPRFLVFILHRRSPRVYWEDDGHH